MKKIFWYCVLFFTVFAGCQDDSGEKKEAPVLIKDPNQDVLDSIHTFLTNYYDVMSERNWPRFQTFFWPKATLTTAWKRPGDTMPKVIVSTIEDFILQTKQGPDSQPVFEEKMTGDPIIRVEKNIATAWARYHAKFGTPDIVTEWDGTDVFTLMRHEGEWKIVSLVYE